MSDITREGNRRIDNYILRFSSDLWATTDLRSRIRSCLASFPVETDSQVHLSSPGAGSCESRSLPPIIHLKVEGSMHVSGCTVNYEKIAMNSKRENLCVLDKVLWRLVNRQ